MKSQINQVKFNNVAIRDSFWSEKQRLFTDIAIPYMECILMDETEGDVKSHAIANFEIAAGLKQGQHYGMVFQDSDVAKWLEAASYALHVKPDAPLEQRIDDIIDVISLAQDNDGYINTYFKLCEPENRWTNLLECHELYCAGHMIEAGVAHFEATGKTNLLDIVKKLADCVINEFGYGKREGIPGHQEIEIGLMRLYEVTGISRYKDMAKRFLDLRGNDPAYFEKNTPTHDGIEYGGYKIDPHDTVYNQSDMPVREQTRPRGHAVRMMYMLTAMANVARVCDDKAMLEACGSVFNNIVNRQMFVTGALGATSHNEAFTTDWHLPSDTMYGETCASVAMVFFAKNMLLSEPDGRYADVMELELFNGALSGMQLDGLKYFYANPLEADERISGYIPGYEHILNKRPAWHGCACCPPNLARLISSLGGYLWSEDVNTLYSHLFIGSTAETRLACVSLETEYPLKGRVTYTISPKEKTAFRLAVHIPAHVRDFKLTINNQPAEGKLINGYLYIEREWTQFDKLALSFDIVARRIYGNSLVRDCAGKVALARGPLIYCIESIDNNGALPHTLRLPRNAEISECVSDDTLLRNIIMLKASGVVEQSEDALYSQTPPRNDAAIITAVPYYAWANRGSGSMAVWIRE